MLEALLTRIFVAIDDFCQAFEKEWEKVLLDSGEKKRKREKSLTTSEMMTIIVAFQQSGFRDFKTYYFHLLERFRGLFPKLVSYSRFVALMPGCIIPLLTYLMQECRGTCTGVSFIDSTKVEVCHNKRTNSHKVFKDLAKMGKSTMGWFYGFKLHLVVNECGELLSFSLTTANIDDRAELPKLTRQLSGKLFGDKGYISQARFEELIKNGLTLITGIRKNMKNRLLTMEDKIYLRKRSIIETINDQLKNICQLVHTRHRSVTGFMCNFLASLIAYAHQPKKPSINLKPKERMEILALP